MERTKTYIVPNELGLIYGAGTLLIFIEGFSNSQPLLNIAGFVLLIFFLVGLFQSNQNLAGVELILDETDPVAAGEMGRVGCRVFNLDNEPHFSVEIKLRGSKPVWVPILPARDSVWVELEVSSLKRGIYRLRDVRFSSTFPLGLFFAWKTCPSKNAHVVFPKPQGNIPPPRVAIGLEEFAGHRPYREGDSLRQIDWRARARGLPWIIKEFENGSIGELTLKERDLARLSTEERLSQLAEWVLKLDRQGVYFALEMDRVSIPQGRGRRHLNQCLEELAK